MYIICQESAIASAIEAVAKAVSLLNLKREKNRINKRIQSLLRIADDMTPDSVEYSRLSDLAARVTAALGTPVASTGLQAASLKDMESAEVVTKVATLFTANQKQSGILASVSMAQFILESGYGKSELAQNANNCFGMKSSLSGNSWAGSAWDGHSVYTMQTGEQNTDGSYVTVTADFRKYGSIEDSIADHYAYLLGAMNGSKKRYEGLAGCTDYKKAVQIIKDGGYATSLDYVQNLCRVIEQWNLTQFDVAASVTPVTPAATLYRVRKNWSDTASQKGALLLSTVEGFVRFGLVGVRGGFEFVDLADRKAGDTGNQIGRKSFMEHTFCVIYFFLLFTALFAAQLSILLMNLINHICVPPTHWMVK